MYLQEKEQDAATRKRGEPVSGVKSTGRRVALLSYPHDGFSLIELVMTMTIMTILTMGVIPLVKVAVRRQKEQQLREVLRQMRTAIDEFHRDTIGMVCTGGAGLPTTGQAGGPAPPQGNQLVDPRSKVVISDCTIFGVDNPDHYPPDLETLKNGVNVMPRGTAGGYGQQGVDATKVGGQLATKKKVYLRDLPIDPITGKVDWDFRSNYDPADSTTWGGENVFDVRSKSKETALNGQKYSDW
jgi:general secretion pathway protein G